MGLTKVPADIVVNPDTAFGISERLGKNKLINGNFAIWQRGTSIAITAAEYVADRWYSDEGTSGVATISRQSFALGQEDVPNDLQYFLRHDQTTGGTAPSLEQRIESVRTFSSDTVTVSFYAKVGSGSMTIIPNLIQHFGTGGSPSINVITAQTGIVVNTLWNKYTVTFTVPSISGKTLGTDLNDYLAVQFVFPDSTIFTFDIAQVQIEKGNVATEYDVRPMGYEVALCQRYYCKTYELDTDPGTVTDVNTIIDKSVNVSSIENIYASWNYPVIMREIPSILFYNHLTGGTATWSELPVPNDRDMQTKNIGRGRVGYSNSEIANNDQIIHGHITADAEL